MKCEVCGNDYDQALTVTIGGASRCSRERDTRFPGRLSDRSGSK